MDRYEHVGGAVDTVLTAQLNNGISDLTFQIADSTGWPTGSLGHTFWVIFNENDPNVEKVECESRTGLTVTIKAGGRGADGSSIGTHAINASVKHCISALEVDGYNAHATQTTGTVHGLTLADVASAAALSVEAAARVAADALKVAYTYATTAPTYNGTPGSQVWWDTNYSPPRAKINNGTSWVVFSGAVAPTVTEGSSTGYTFSTLTNPDGDGKNYRLGILTASTGSLLVTDTGSAEILVVGGGGGGALLAPGGSGGGGGGVRWGRFTIPTGTHSCLVGGGGAANTDGGDSSLGSILKAGGGQRGLVVNSRWAGTGGGGSAGAYNTDPSFTYPGGGAGGTIYGANSASGISLSITGASVEYGAGGGATGAGATNLGQGGGADGTAGGSGLIAVRWEI